MPLTNLPLSIIVPTKNRPYYLKRCFTALLSEIKQEDQIIICDNSTNKNLFKFYQSLKKNHRNIYYCSVKIPGSSAARNAGIALAHNKYLVFLDDDCVIDNRWRKAVNQVIKKEISTGKYAIHQGIIRYQFGQQNIQSQLFNLRQNVTKKLLKLDKKSSQQAPILYLNAGNFFLHASVLKKLGYLFDSQNFPYVGEERDLAIRAQLKNIPILLEPAVVVTHSKNKASIFSGLKRNFLQGVATTKLINRYTVKQSITHLLNITQKDGFIEVFNQTISATPRNFSNQITALVAQSIMMLYKLAYLIGKRLY